MPSRIFTLEEKQYAVRLLKRGWREEDVARKCTCSVSSLKRWSTQPWASGVKPGFYLKSSWIFYALIVGVVVTLLSKGLDLTTPTNGKNTSLSTSTELMDPRTEGSHLSRSDLLEIIQSELKELIWIEISDTLRTEMIPVIREEITPLIRTQVEGTLRSELAPLIRKEMQDTLRIQFQPSPVPPKWNNAKDKKPKDKKLKDKAVIEDDIVIFFATLFLGSLFGVGILVGKVGIRKSSWAVYGVIKKFLLIIMGAAIAVSIAVIAGVILGVGKLVQIIKKFK